MAQIILEISDEDHELYKNDETYFQNLLRQTFHEAAEGIKTGQSVWVKAMTRLQTPVVNWDDLEKQILKGSVG
jgi:hypothetical protein